MDIIAKVYRSRPTLVIAMGLVLIGTVCTWLLVSGFDKLTMDVTKLRQAIVKEHAQSWGRYVSTLARDGGQVDLNSPRLKQKLMAAIESGALNRIKLFDTTGRLVLDLPEDGAAPRPANNATPEPDVLSVLKTGASLLKVEVDANTLREHAEAYVPVVLDSKAVAVIEIYLSMRREWQVIVERQALENRRFSTFIMLTAVVLSTLIWALLRVENARITRALDRKTNLWKFQAQLLHATTRSSTAVETARSVALTLEGAIEGSVCAVLRRHGDVLNPFAGPSMPDDVLQKFAGLPVVVGHGSCGTAAATGKPQFVSDTQCDERWARYAELAQEIGVRSCWSHPLVATNDRILGTISLSFSDSREPDETVMNLLNSAAFFLANRLETEMELEARALAEAEKRSAEELAQRTQSFFATMSHELRTPLNGILGVLDLIRSAKAHRIPALLNSATASAETLLELVSEVLELARLENAKERSASKPFSIRNTIESIYLSLSPLSRAKDIAFNVEISEDLPAMLHGRVADLRLMLINLAGNAIKFTKTGAITISASLLDTSDERCRVRVVVADTGIGMSPETQRRMYDEFFSGTTSAISSGLGLSIVSRLVNQLKGSIVCESALGKGTTFTIDMDFEPATEDQVDERKSEKSAVDEYSIDPNTAILLVEDNETNAMIAMEMLNEIVNEVRWAKNGEEAVEAATTGNFDIVLMDISMPGIDGVEACRRIRERIAKEELPAIVCLTAHAIEGDRERFLSQGFDTYLSKPVRRALLHEVVASQAQARAGRRTEFENRGGATAEDGSEGLVLNWTGPKGLDREAHGKLLADCRPKSIPRILEVCRTELAGECRAALSAHLAGDLNELKRRLHSIGGLAANVGALNLQALAARGQEADEHQLSLIVPKVAEEVDLVQKELKPREAAA